MATDPVDKNPPSHKPLRRVTGRMIAGGVAVLIVAVVIGLSPLPLPLKILVVATVGILAGLFVDVSGD